MLRTLMIFCLLPIMAAGQVSIFNNGVEITIDSSTSFTVSGSFTATNGGMVRNNGTLEISGDWSNNSSTGLFTDSTGHIAFIGGNAQYIGGLFPSNFKNLTINKSGGYVILNNNNNTVTGSLELQNGYLILGAYTLIIDSNAIIYGNPGEDSYVKAYGTGMLRKNFSDTGSFEFPVGGTDYYTPFTVYLSDATFSGNDFFAVNVTDGAHFYVNHYDYLNRYWTLNSGGFADVEYEVEMTYHESDVYGDEAVILCQFYDGDWNLEAITDTAANLLNSAGPLIGLPSFIDFTGAGPVFLPVSLLYFRANWEDNKVALAWATAVEQNNDYFLVERSSNATEFRTIKKVNGAGTTSAESTYFTYDEHPGKGKIYYRLKQVDLNGAFAYSPVEVVEIKEDRNRISYNIDENSLIIHFAGSTGISEVILYDLNGRVVFSTSVTNVDNETYQIKLPASFAPSIYFVSVKNESGTVINGKILKQ